MDTATRIKSLTDPLGALLLFDFSAAFPSVSHDYLWEILDHIGVPPHFLHAIKSLYIKNTHQLVLDNGLYPSFELKSGVRQGCPLSPTLFVLCIDMLLTKLEQNLPLDTTLRAFADDIGIVITNRRQSLPTLAHLFHRFSQYSALNLNLQKTLLIPFSPLTNTDTNLLHQIGWQHLDTNHKTGKYLGIHIGPSATPQNTLKEIEHKYTTRLNTWNSAQLPLSYRIRVYNMFLHPPFSFAHQFTIVPPSTTNNPPGITKTTERTVPLAPNSNSPRHENPIPIPYATKRHPSR